MFPGGFPFYSNSCFEGIPLIKPASKAQKHQFRTKLSWDFVALCFRGNTKRELLPVFKSANIHGPKGFANFTCCRYRFLNTIVKIPDAWHKIQHPNVSFVLIMWPCFDLFTPTTLTAFGAAQLDIRQRYRQEIHRRYLPRAQNRTPAGLLQPQGSDY